MGRSREEDKRCYSLFLPRPARWASRKCISSYTSLLSWCWCVCSPWCVCVFALVALDICRNLAFLQYISDFVSRWMSSFFHWGFYVLLLVREMFGYSAVWITCEWLKNFGSKYYWIKHVYKCICILVYIAELSRTGCCVACFMMTLWFLIRSNY